VMFFNRANSFFRGLPFCNFVKNKIYVIEVEMLKPLVLARNHKFDNSDICRIFNI
jgi:hypothetical protein